ncbi:glutamate formimidoyltransferase [Candidatus Micrarchaeota archaeon]|nr:glutamate formimidoyltransferase [Candidatus Micrarchaeota archaeon]
MAKKIVECVPNFSEGKDQKKIDAIVAEIKSVPGITVLSSLADADHNRLDVSYLGEPEAVKTAAFAACKLASKLIDMEKHHGQHPRMGATDVIPFIPIQGVTMAECVELANDVGQKIGDELGIPVYLYESAAKTPSRTNLADVRRGEYEGIKTEFQTNPNGPRKPDYGPTTMHPSAGFTGVCARMPLVAFNVNLATTDVSIAKAIAKAVREKDGGLKCVKAMGFVIKEKGIVQVSMNLTNYLETPIFKAFEAVKAEAQKHGVQVIESEIIGMVPLQALSDTADFYLRLEKFKSDQVIEARLIE